MIWILCSIAFAIVWGTLREVKHAIEICLIDPVKESSQCYLPWWLPCCHNCLSTYFLIFVYLIYITNLCAFLNGNFCCWLFLAVDFLLFGHFLWIFARLYLLLSVLILISLFLLVLWFVVATICRFFTQFVKLF